jgi:hypothetical protein
MKYSAAYLSGEPAPLGEQIANIWREWTPAHKRKPFWPPAIKAEVKNEVAGLALLAPSLIAEVAPITLFWHSHLPVWEMLGLMAGSFAFTWWMTWMLVGAIRGPAQPPL